MSRIVSLQSGIARSASESEYPWMWPAASWAMIEGGGTTAFDWSGNGGHGTLTNDPAWTAWNGGSSLLFDGVNDRVMTPMLFRPGASPFTLMAWCNGLNTTQLGSLISTRPVGFDVFASKVVGLVIGNPITGSPTKQFGFLLFDTVNRYRSYTTNASLVDGNWHHVAAVWSGSGATMFVDGDQVAITEDASGSLPVIDGGGFVSLGDANSTVAPLHGMLDDVLIYNRAWSDTEIASKYQLGPKAHLIPQRLRSAFAVTITYNRRRRLLTSCR